MKKKWNIIIGSKYGKWTVLETGFIYKKPCGDTIHKTLCICDCGRKLYLQTWSLENKKTTGCRSCVKLGHIPWNKNTKGKMKSNKTSFEKGFTPWNKGMKMLDRTGSNHYLWREDREELYLNKKRWYSVECAEWRTKIFTRDGFKCRMANEYCKGQLEAHHILPWRDYPESRFIINNGITLCHAHHPRKRKDVAELSPYLEQLVAET